MADDWFDHENPLAGVEIVDFPDRKREVAARLKAAGERFEPLPASDATQHDENAAGVDGELTPPGGRALPAGQLPPDCPVTPLGLNDDVYFYIDANGQLRALKAEKHGRLNVLALFGDDPGFLRTWWPRWGKGNNGDAEITGWRPEEAAEALMATASRCGVWDAARHTRGRGAWLADDGGLIVHAGDGVWHSTESTWRAPGRIGGHVYPAAPPVPRPADFAAGRGPDGAGAQLKSILSTWNWRRGDLDAQLMLGWVGAAFLGGAFQWRPSVWVTGDKATGKSTLHQAIERIFGDAILTSADTSAAGISQALKVDALPVATDELEADTDNKAAQGVIRLARLAASGGVIRRGGADHQGVEFFARSCYLFSSILMPPLQPQDRSRLAILELRPFTARTAGPDLAPDRLGEIGRQLFRRMVDGWPRFNDTLEIYRAALSEHAGHGGRGADQFGTLLAAADLLLEDDVPDLDTAEEWARRLPAAGEEGDSDADQFACLSHLLSSLADPRGTGDTIGQLVSRAAGRSSQVDALDLVHAAKLADGTLQKVGLRVVADRWGFDGTWLAVAGSHSGLARTFAGTHWHARSGASSPWGQSLERLPGAVKPGKVMKFAGASAKPVLVPIGVVLDDAVEDSP